MLPNAQNIKRYFSLKEITVISLAVVISVLAGVGVFYSLKKEVIINDNGKQLVVETMKSTVKEVFEQNGISVSTDDYVSLPLDTKLQKIKTNKIDIKRAVPVNIIADGQQIKLMTYRDTVKDALTNSAMKLSDTDKLDGVSLDDKIVSNMNIKIIRVSEEVVSEKQPIPFQVVNRENNRMDKGDEKIVREGQEGIREKLYKVVVEDGKQVAKNFLNENVLSAPIDKIVEFGTILNHKTSRGEVIRYSKVLSMRSTAYTASYADTGKSPGDPGFGVTYTGTRVRKGVIAVDPKVIPLGTRVFVEVAGDTPDYGYAIAADIGGAIKGDLIDLYFNEQGTVSNWGCKRVKVYILNDQ